MLGKRGKGGEGKRRRTGRNSNIRNQQQEQADLWRVGRVRALDKTPELEWGRAIISIAISIVIFAVITAVVCECLAANGTARTAECPVLRKRKRRRPATNGPEGV